MGISHGKARLTALGCLKSKMMFPISTLWASSVHLYTISWHLQIWPRAGMIGVIGLGASGGIFVTSWEGQRSLKGDEIDLQFELDYPKLSALLVPLAVIIPVPRLVKQSSSLKDTQMGHCRSSANRKTGAAYCAPRAKAITGIMFSSTDSSMSSAATQRNGLLKSPCLQPALPSKSSGSRPLRPFVIQREN
eukprot:gene862-961_t